MRSHPARAFTLIELLVVISIVSLLISILLPALAGAREAGTQLSCLTRLRSQGQALMMYQGDEKDYYPYGQDTRTGSNPQQNNGWRYLHQSLARYMGLQDTKKATRDANHEKLHCPILWQEWASQVGDSNYQAGYGLYAYNPMMMGYIGSSGYLSNTNSTGEFGRFALYTSGNQNVRTTDIEALFNGPTGGASSTVILADGYNVLGATATVDNQMLTDGQQIFSAPHFETASYRNYSAGTQFTKLFQTGGQCNVYYMDGHARPVKPEIFPGGAGLASWQIDP